MPVGASLLARDNLVSTVKGLATKYRTRAGLERELKRYERRGATARNRFERQVRKTRTRFERELRQRRTRVERTVKQNRRRLEREVRSVRKDLEQAVRAARSRVEKLVSDAQELLTQLLATSPAGAQESAEAGEVRRPHNLAGERSTLSSLNRRGVTKVAPRRSLRAAESAGSAGTEWLCQNGPCPPETKYATRCAPSSTPSCRHDIVELEMVRSIDIHAERRGRRDGLADHPRLPDPQPLPDRRGPGGPRSSTA